MGLPAANVELHAEAPRVDPDCFDMESEIEFWKMHAFRFDLPPSQDPCALYVDLVRFSYDCYLLHGRHPFGAVEAPIKARFSTHPLRFRCDWSQASPILSAVWRRMRTTGD